MMINSKNLGIKKKKKWNVRTSGHTAYISSRSSLLLGRRADGGRTKLYERKLWEQQKNGKCMELTKTKSKPTTGMDRPKFSHLAPPTWKK